MSTMAQAEELGIPRGALLEIITVLAVCGAAMAAAIYMDRVIMAVGGGNHQPVAGGMGIDNMRKKPFSFTARQLIGIGILGGLVLLLIFGLGVRAGEKRALRKQFTPNNNQSVLPTPTLILPSPTVYTSPTSNQRAPIEFPSPQPTLPAEISPASERRNEREQYSIPITCTKDTNCIICYVEGSVCTAGDCINGVCVWPTLPPSPPRR